MTQYSTERRVATLNVAPNSIRISDNTSATLILPLVAEGIAVLAYDPVARVAGALHYTLPLSKLDPLKAELKPTYFADRGVPKFFHALYEYGASKNNLTIKVVGGMQSSDRVAAKTAKKNVLIFRKLCWKNTVMIAGEDTGGNRERRIALNVGSGIVRVNSGTVSRDL